MKGYNLCVWVVCFAGIRRNALRGFSSGGVQCHRGVAAPSLVENDSTIADGSAGARMKRL